jgi:hypothetical protein
MGAFAGTSVPAAEANVTAAGVAVIVNVSEPRSVILTFAVFDASWPNAPLANNSSKHNIEKNFRFKLLFIFPPTRYPQN